MLLMSLWMGQTALTESGLVISLGMGIPAVMLACFGGSILTGVFEPEGIPDEQMSSLTSLLIAAMLAVGVIALLLIVLFPYV
ncbi:hypothetical protein GCM10008995_01690 [Halobellus salinus]|uniref:Uncharacterized protein n=2 Tax=Halobellus salinus TaxID=931585 RepID=A0A830EBV9_9EURY|nr:hypothetical protein GCM10008995_01690 [Halobellus salinus]SMP11910.1 hypothetical protein SAMN06265347_10411 [Halobellus salinus]